MSFGHENNINNKKHLHFEKCKKQHFLTNNTIFLLLGIIFKSRIVLIKMYNTKPI